MKIMKWVYFTRKIWEKQGQLWDREFTKRILGESREGLRIEYDRLKEQVDAAQRRLCVELYTVIDGPGGNEVDIRTLPLSPTDIEQLPTAATEESRFYKVAKPDPDKTIVEQMQKKLATLQPDLQQLANKMQEIAKRIEGPLVMTDQSGQQRDYSLNAEMGDFHTIINLLRVHRKNL